MRQKPILCVDFDGVVHSYTTPWTNEFTIHDPPVLGALAWLWKATEWFNVNIYSSRSNSEEGISAMIFWFSEWSKKEFGEYHPIVEVPFEFPRQKPAAFLTIDDRAICFEGDWSELDPFDLLNFKPWNKRLPADINLPKGEGKGFPSSLAEPIA